jgi:nucleotide-binding universal stress UspA family protein
MTSTVVVGYDQTPSSERALREAAREAAWRGASLTVVNAFQWISAVPPMAYSAEDVQDSVKTAAEQIAAHGADVARDIVPGTPVQPLARDGAAAEVLAVASRGADLLVVGNRGRGGFAGLLLGSVSMRALGAACVPTVVVRGSERAPGDLVVVAVDIEQPTRDILEFAFVEASRRGARLEVVHVWDMSWALENADGTAEAEAAAKQANADLDAVLEAAVHTWQARFPDVRATRRVADGTPSAVLTHASQHADLVVVGARRHPDGQHGMRVGPVAHALLHHADCPVAVVPMD